MHVFVFFLAGCIYAQGQVFYDKETDQEYEIDVSMPELVLQRFLKSKRAVEVVFGDYIGEYRVRTKRGKWYAYRDGEKLNRSAADSVALPGEMFENHTLIVRKGVYQLVPRDSGDFSLECEGIRVIERSSYYDTPIMLVKKDNAWGQMSLDGRWIQLNVFDHWKKVPVVYDDGWIVDVCVALRSKIGVDVILPDPNNGDGIFKVRHAETGLWGMYQYIGDEPTVLIPMEYDSVDFFAFNGEITTVYKNGKLGFYAWGERGQTVPCKYEAYQKKWYRYSRTSPEMFYMLVQRAGKWGVVDWWTGEELTAFDADTAEGVNFKIKDSGYYTY
jgi:hypothetical protein